ncbi:Protein of unknown function [Gryllus bimaculatus]|nr:Protein of unknown function [Gryllus bimaculatus]
MQWIFYIVCVTFLCVNNAESKMASIKSNVIMARTASRVLQMLLVFAVASVKTGVRLTYLNVFAVQPHPSVSANQQSEARISRFVLGQNLISSAPLNLGRGDFSIPLAAERAQSPLGAPLSPARVTCRYRLSNFNPTPLPRGSPAPRGRRQSGDNGLGRGGARGIGREGSWLSDPAGNGTAPRGGHHPISSYMVFKGKR